VRLRIKRGGSWPGDRTMKDIKRVERSEGGRREWDWCRGKSIDAQSGTAAASAERERERKEREKAGERREREGEREMRKSKKREMKRWRERRLDELKEARGRSRVASK